MQSYEFATFWVEQWLKFLSAAGTWPAVDRDRLDAQLAELRAGADRVESELKSVADERQVLRRDLAAAEQAAKASADALAAAQLELTKQRELADEERRLYSEHVARLQRQLEEAVSAADAAATERNAIAATRDRLADERARLAAELDRVRKAAEDERQRLQSTIRDMQQARDMQRAGEATGSARQAVSDLPVAAGLEVHFKKPSDWGEPLFVHYWNEDRRTTWPGEPMTAEGDGWFSRSLRDVRSVTLVFNDNKGHQTPDLGRDRAGWYDGTWHEEKPERPARRKARNKEPA